MVSLRIGKQEILMILILENDNDTREALHLSLRDHFSLKLARNTEEAIRYLEDGLSPSLILYDNQLQQNRKSSFIQRLRTEFPELDHIPLIVMSVREDKLLPPGIHADRVLLKPFGYEELLAILKSNLP